MIAAKMANDGEGVGAWEQLLTDILEVIAPGRPGATHVDSVQYWVSTFIITLVPFQTSFITLVHVIKTSS